MKTDELTSWLADNGVRMVRTEGISIDGLSVGKHLSPGKFLRSLPLGPAVSDAVLAADVAGGVNIGLLGKWSGGFLGDIHQSPDLSTLVMLAGRPGVASCIVDHVDVAGEPLPVCPRVTLQRVQQELAQRGFEARLGFEIEAMIFQESFAEARAKGYRELQSLGVPVPVAYLNQSAHLQAPFMEEVTRRLDALAVEWEAWSDELALGQVELNLAPADPLRAADSAHRARQVFREVAYDLDHSVTFMGKPTAAIGNGLHIHHSLLRDGTPVFHDAEAPEGRSEIMRHWMAGLLATMDGAVSLLVPTVNAYRRMVDFAGAPTTATWGEENKSAALRVVSRSPGVARIEHRLGSGELNPYVAAAGILAGGMVGLDEALEPPEATTRMAWAMGEGTPVLPAKLSAAADALEADERMIGLLGAEFVEHWIKTRRWEWQAFCNGVENVDAAEITLWELNRYFELS
ncbi:MAG: glutamine synthetase [Deltaproteobacteria bacterium]|nr:glutamine synthetase [Deltaproteobacteria bacterium]